MSFDLGEHARLAQLRLDDERGRKRHERDNQAERASEDLIEAQQAALIHLKPMLDLGATQLKPQSAFLTYEESTNDSGFPRFEVLLEGARHRLARQAAVFSFWPGLLEIHGDPAEAITGLGYTTHQLSHGHDLSKAIEEALIALVERYYRAKGLFEV